MNIIGVQLILLFFGIFMLYVLFLYWRKRSISHLYFLLWVIVWVVFVLITLFPKFLEPLIKDLFIVRVMDLGMIGAFMLLTFLTVENNIKIKKYEEQLENLVRKIAIMNNSYKVEKSKKV